MKILKVFIGVGVLALLIYSSAIGFNYLINNRVKALAAESISGSCPSDQYLQGYDKNTGEAICITPNISECPYASAEPANSAVCQKLQAEATPAFVLYPNPPGFVGK